MFRKGHDCSRASRGGASERILGKVPKGRRDQAVICTKFGNPAGTTVAGLSRRHLEKQLEDSLRRLEKPTMLTFPGAPMGWLGGDGRVSESVRTMGHQRQGALRGEFELAVLANCASLRDRALHRLPRLQVTSPEPNLLRRA